MKGIYLFLDDIRKVSEVYPSKLDLDWFVVKSYEEFITYITENGLPDFRVHSANPAGADNIRGILSRFRKFQITGQ